MYDRSVERSLLGGFEYPVAFVVEVTRQGILLSKLRYLRALGQLIADTLQCPNIEVYLHMGDYVDTHIEQNNARPPGVHLIYQFDIDKQLFRETVDLLGKGRLMLNMNNPQTQGLARNLMGYVERGRLHAFRKLNPHEQGLILEPYCSLVFDKVGIGKRVILQNVEIVRQENALRVANSNEDALYHPNALPSMEIDILMIIEMEHAHTVLKGLERVGFSKRSWA